MYSETWIHTHSTSTYTQALNRLLSLHSVFLPCSCQLTQSDCEKGLAYSWESTTLSVLSPIPSTQMLNITHCVTDYDPRLDKKNLHWIRLPWTMLPNLWISLWYVVKLYNHSDCQSFLDILLGGSESTMDCECRVSYWRKIVCSWFLSFFDLWSKLKWKCNAVLPNKLHT